jgi:GMP synthase (glutamine-hydrolysing)
LQFHIEADPRQLEEWYVGHAAELAAAKISASDLRVATLRHKEGLAPRADRVFTRWLRQISLSNAPT